ISKGRYAFSISTDFGPWISQPRTVALFSLKTTCGLGPFDHCNALCRTDCTGVKLRDIAPDATLASDPGLSDFYVPTLAQQTAICRATRKLHGASLGELCKRLLTNPAEAAEKILTTSMYAPFDTPIEDVLLAQARLRASRCALTRAALEASGNLPLTFITTSNDKTKSYTSLELDDGKIGLYTPGSNPMGQVWEEIRSGGSKMLREPFHVICTTAEKVIFEKSAATVHIADDMLQKTRFFENNSFSGNCVVALVTLGTAERARDGKEDMFDQLLATIAKVPYIQVIITPPPPILSDAYDYQAKQLLAKFPELYNMTDNGGSLLQIGRYGARTDHRYVLGNEWDKDGIMMLKAHLVQVLGHHWLRNPPKANATFPLRQLHQMQLASTSNAHRSDRFHASNLQPTPTRLHDARLHSTRGGRITRRDAPARSNQHSNNGLDPRLLNDIIAALQPSGSSSKPRRTNPKRQ
ncbi:hypothetical protein AAVH_20933, partial [Aphelenchoides avenae]